MTRTIRSFLVACFMVGFFACSAHSAVWRGHTVKAKLVGQIDASPCGQSSCLNGIVGVIVDGHDVGDHVVRCAWPRHPRVLAFDHGRHHHRLGWYARVRTCGRGYWWRFR